MLQKLIIVSVIFITLCGIMLHYKSIHYPNLAQTNIIQPVKVFQVGFSRCGTITLASFFHSNRISSIHHDYGQLATSIYDNHINGRPLLSKNYASYTIYTDMEKMHSIPQLNIGQLLFKELDRQYPGSKFILNSRNKAAWLTSRSLFVIPKLNRNLLELTMELQNLSRQAVLDRWSQEWDQHHAAVLEYFKDRPQDLLIFNIDSDPPEKITAFFKDYFVLDPKLYRHLNKTPTSLFGRLFAQLSRYAL